MRCMFYEYMFMYMYFDASGVIILVLIIEYRPVMGTSCKKVVKLNYFFQLKYFS